MYLPIQELGMPARQFTPPSSSGPIGCFREKPDTANTQTEDDGSLWLKTGLAVALSAAGIGAQRLEHLFVSGVTKALPVSTTAIKDVASNGTGTIVIAYGNGTNVMVSTDGGDTFSLVAHNAGATVNAVAWDGTNFVCASSNGTSWVFSTSPTGAVFTQRTTGIGNVNSSVVMQAGNGVLIAVVSTGSLVTAGVRSTDHGVTWASVTMGGTGVNTAAKPAYGAGVWLIGDGSATVGWQKSVNDGVTWTNFTGPNVALCVAYGDGVFASVATGGASALQTSSDGATWTSETFRISNPANIAAPALALTGVGGRLFTAAGTLNAINVREAGAWRVRSLLAAAGTGNSMHAAIAGNSGGIVFLPVGLSGSTASSTYYKTPNFAAPDFVGTYKTYMGATLPLYVRIK